LAFDGLAVFAADARRIEHGMPSRTVRIAAA